MARQTFTDRRPVICHALGLLLAALSGTVQARAPAEGFVHWAYSAYLGTGWYRVRGDQDVFVARLSPRWKLDKRILGGEGNRDIDVEFRLPMTLGLHRLDFDDLPGLIDPDNFGTVSLVPGVEAEVPVTGRWSLRPHLYLGAGTEIDGPQSAWIYWTGVKSRYQLGGDGSDWSLVNSLGYIGYTPNEGPSSDAVPLMAGVENRWSLGNWRGDSKPLYLDGHATYTAYLDDLKFFFNDRQAVKLADEWELGLALSRGHEKFSFWRLKWDRIGLAYRFGGSGDFKGVSLVFRSVFER
jgi:hypothetical protein